MKQNWDYYRIKWTAFSITICLLGIVLGIVLLSNRLPEQEITKEPDPSSALSADGFYSNEEFSRLLKENLKEFDLIGDLSFQGTEEGRFIISGILKDHERLIAICPELAGQKERLKSLEGATFSLAGHLGEGEDGAGQLIADTIDFPDLQIAAGEATFYIEQYTTVNTLFAVPLDEITLNEEGITYQKELPAVIQTA